MITGVVSEADYVGAYTLHRRSVAVAINWVLGTIAAAGLLLAIFGVKPWGLFLFLGGVGGLIGEAVQAHLYVPKQARKFYSQFKGIDAPITYRWNAEKLSVHSDRGNGERNWRDLLKVKEDDRLLLLYTTDALFEVVPKGWFQTPAQLSEFQSYARGRTSGC